MPLTLNVPAGWLAGFDVSEVSWRPHYCKLVGAPD
jgi:hypothetical protein